jgi:fumarate hydratase class I
MATPQFVYQDPLPLEKDSTQYRLLTKDFVSVSQFEGKDILKVAPEGLTYLANVAIRDVSFLLRTAHLEKVAAILKDPAASQNDRYVALAMLRNADTSSKGILPFCQDTGTATVFGKKGPAGVDRCEGRGAYRQGESIKPIPRKIFATRKRRRSICGTRSTPVPICRRRST